MGRPQGDLGEAEGVGAADLGTGDVDVAVRGALRSVTEEANVGDNLLGARPRVQHGQFRDGSSRAGGLGGGGVAPTQSVCTGCGQSYSRNNTSTHQRRQCIGRRELTDVEVNTEDIAIEIPQQDDTTDSDDDGSLNLENILEEVETLEHTLLENRRLSSVYPRRVSSSSSESSPVRPPPRRPRLDSDSLEGRNRPAPLYSNPPRHVNMFNSNDQMVVNSQSEQPIPPLRLSNLGENVDCVHTKWK